MWLEGKSKAQRQVLHYTIKEGSLRIWIFSLWVSNAVMEVEEKGNNQLYEMVHVKE